MISAGIMKRCLEEAEKSEYFPYKVGAVIFSKSRILGSGHNDVRTCRAIPTKHKLFNEALHAEQAALAFGRQNCSNDLKILKGSSILVIRQNSTTGSISMGKPCDMCHRMLKKFGIKWMYYSDRKGQIIKEKV